MRLIEGGLKKRSRPPPSTTCAHETSMRKRHRYVTVIINGDTGKTLRMVEHRSSAAAPVAHLENRIDELYPSESLLPC